MTEAGTCGAAARDGVMAEGHRFGARARLRGFRKCNRRLLARGRSERRRRARCAAFPAAALPQRRGGRLAGPRARAAARVKKKEDTAANREDALSQRREARSSRRCRAGAGETHDDLSRSSHCTGTTAVALKKSHNVKVVAC